MQKLAEEKADFDELTKFGYEWLAKLEDGIRINESKMEDLTQKNASYAKWRSELVKTMALFDEGGD